MNRRDFIKTSGLLSGSVLLGCSNSSAQVPSYLADYKDLYLQDPRRAAIEYFRNAKFGMFLHYGLYSLLGRHEWVQLREKIPVAEYAKLKDQFTAEKFNADFITDLALEAEMKYINITTRHHDSFSLFETKQNDFHSVNSPAKRDLIGELAEACQEKGLGFYLYYSHGRDWRHPHAPNNDEWGGSARPKYDPPEPYYAYGEENNLQKYLDFMEAQIMELLSNYGPLGCIWLDGIAVPAKGDFSKFKCQDLYDKIHAAQPQVLVSYKQGLLGTEDFFAPEHNAVENPQNKPMEICTTLQENPRSWGYHKESKSRTVDEVWDVLATARSRNCNLLLNTGPKGDGSIMSEHVKIYREIGKRIRQHGWPEKA
jgi:alpha-L-fucosidase